jgi:hypothetical protein
MQHFWQSGPHPGPLTGGKDDGKACAFGHGKSLSGLFPGGKSLPGGCPAIGGKPRILLSVRCDTSHSKRMKAVGIRLDDRNFNAAAHRP